MVALPNAFNVADVPDDDFEPVAAGTYTAMITESEMKATNDGEGAYIQLKLELDNGRVLFERLNIQNKNEKAVEIAYRTLGKICSAMGKVSIKDTSELHDQRFKVEIDIEKGKDYTDKETGELKKGRDQNRIKKYLPNAAAASSTSGSAAPADAASTPPWKK